MKEERYGEYCVYLKGVLWSFFPIITILSFSGLSPIFSAGASTIVAALFFLIVVTIKKEWHFIYKRSAWKHILYASLLNGVLFYFLIFVGTSKTSAGNVAIIGILEIFFTMVILKLWGKELLSRNEALGGILTLIGTAFIFFPGSFQINAGDIFILIAVMTPPFGNYFTQLARKEVSASFILFIRSLIGGVFLLVLSACVGGLPNSTEFSETLIYILINGAVLMGFSKILWIEAIHRIPISKALSLAFSIAPPCTLFFAYLILDEVPTWFQITGLIPILSGVFFLTRKKMEV